MFGPAWSYNFKKIKVNEEKLYVYYIVFASYVNLNQRDSIRGGPETAVIL